MTAPTSSNSAESNNNTTEANNVSKIQSTLQDFHAAQQSYGINLVKDATGTNNSNVIRYPFTTDEFNYEKLVSAALREQFDFTKDISEFNPGRTVKPSGIFVSLLAMKTNYRSTDRSMTVNGKKLWDIQTPLYDSILDTLLSKEEAGATKEGQKPRELKYAFGKENNLLLMQPHAHFHVPFGLKEYDWKRGSYIPGFTKERRREMLCVAASIALNEKNKGKYSEEVMELAKIVVEQGADKLSYAPGNDQQKQLLSATQMLDNIAQVYLSNVHGTAINADPSIGIELNKSRAILTDRFNRIAHASGIPAGDVALFCVVGFYNTFYVWQPAAEDKEKFAPTMVLRTFTELDNAAMPTGFCVGVTHLQQSEQAPGEDEFIGNGCIGNMRKLGYDKSNFTMTIQNLSDLTVKMEADRAERLVQQALNATTNPQAPAISTSINSSEAAAIGIVPASVAGKLPTTDISLDVNSRIGQVAIIHAACLRAKGALDHSILLKVEETISVVKASKDKAVLNTALANLNAFAKKHYNESPANIKNFFESYEALLLAGTDVGALVTALEAELKLNNGDSIVNYVKQVAIAVYYASGVKDAEVQAACAVLIEEEINPWIDVVKAGKNIKNNSVNVFASLQQRRKQLIPGFNQTFGNFLDSYVSLCYKDADKKAWREEQEAGINGLLTAAKVAPKAAAPAVVEPKAAEPTATSSAPVVNNVAVSDVTQNIAALFNKAPKATSEVDVVLPGDMAD